MRSLSVVRALFVSTLVASVGLVGCGGPEDPVHDFYGQSEDGLTACPGSSTLQGIDVSQWQGTVNWTAVAGAGKKFAFARVSDGLSLDSKFATNWAGIKNAGLIRGVYQFFRPNLDAMAQANLLLKEVGTIGRGDLAPVLDVEVTGGVAKATIVTGITNWVNTVKAKTGRTPIIYTGSYFWNSNVGSSAFSSDPLWLPAYGPTCPTLPTPWTKWTIHQYSETGTVAGISGVVDLDIFNGTLTDLQHLAGM